MRHLCCISIVCAYQYVKVTAPNKAGATDAYQNRFNQHPSNHRLLQQNLPLADIGTTAVIGIPW
jgi:hypothetical protein